MKFEDVNNRATELFKENHEVKFYEMVLCFSLEELFNETEEISLSEHQFNKLLNCMTNYLADDYHESPWHVADALVAVIKKHDVDKTIEDFTNDGKLFEAELYKIESGSY